MFLVAFPSLIKKCLPEGTTVFISWVSPFSWCRVTIICVDLHWPLASPRGELDLSQRSFSLPTSGISLSKICPPVSEMMRSRLSMFFFFSSLTSLSTVMKNKGSFPRESEMELVKYHSALDIEEEDQMKETSLLPLDSTLECHSPPPDYNSVVHYSTVRI